MGLRLKYAVLGACLVGVGAFAQAQTAPAPGDDPFVDPYSDPSDDAVQEGETDEAGVDVLDLYGFRAAQKDEADLDAEARDAPPFTPETPVFEGVPEGVDTNLQPTPDGVENYVDPQALETELLEALDEGPAPLFPDEMDADADFLEEQGLELPRQDRFEVERSQMPGTDNSEAVGRSNPQNADEAAGDDDDPATNEEGAEPDLEAAAEDAQRVMYSMPGARLRVLDKISGRAEDIEVGIGDTLSHRALDVTVRACYKTPPEELPPESAAYLEVLSNRVDAETGSALEEDPRLFAGWMFASSPGLNAMEHSIYDVWVITCTASAPESE